MHFLLFMYMCVCISFIIFNAYICVQLQLDTAKLVYKVCRMRVYNNNNNK